ncbi:MAG: hypothetical protein EVA89_26400 [Sandaracinaceae bacterium]|nr:MAG: hypothetical protein EVA89_26400 [Sandaracinaceae bacterium]
MRNLTWMTLVLASLMAFGCDDGAVDPDGGMDLPDTGMDPDTGTMMDPDTGVMMGDGNDTFADADPLEDPMTMGAIAQPGDLDYYSFTGTAGQWVIIETNANPDDDPEMIDTVITLYDESMTQIAENDDSQPRVNTDSEIITQLPADGTYYILVQEFTTWAGETAEGQADFTYELSFGGLNFDAEVVTGDAESGDDAASANALGFAMDTMGMASDFGIVAGDFRDGSDVDVFSFSITPGRFSLTAQLMPVGTDGNGATVTPAAIWITNADGSQIIARVDPSMLESVNPPLPEGDYLLWVEHGGAASSADFYVMKLFRGRIDNPPETMEATNGVAATPEPLSFEAIMDVPDAERAFIGATVGDGDTDFYSLEVTDASEVVSIFCGSRTAGSGVVDLQAALTDSTGTTVIEMATETATDGIAIQEASVSAAGTYLLRLTKGSQDAEVTGNWARCGVVVGPPAPTP